MDTKKNAYDVLSELLKEFEDDGDGKLLELSMDKAPHNIEGVLFSRIHEKGKNPIDSQIVVGSDDIGRGRVNVYSFGGKETDEKIASYLKKWEFQHEVSGSVIVRPVRFTLFGKPEAAPPDGNIRLLGNEYAITHEFDPNPVISVRGLDPGVGLLMYDVKLGVGGVAHVADGSDATKIFDEMLEKLEERGGRMFALGCTPNVDPLQRRYMFDKLEGGTHIAAYVPNGSKKVRSHVVGKTSQRLFVEIELPDEFSFDARTGGGYPFRESQDPTLKMRSEKNRRAVSCVYEATFAPPTVAPADEGSLEPFRAYIRSKRERHDGFRIKD